MLHLLRSHNCRWDGPDSMFPLVLPAVKQFALRAIPVGGFVSFPNNYEVNPKGEVKEFDDPDLLGNR